MNDEVRDAVREVRASMAVRGDYRGNTSEDVVEALWPSLGLSRDDVDELAKLGLRWLARMKPLELSLALAEDEDG